MRGLTPKQKKLLRDWFNKNYDGGYMFDLAEKIDIDTYEDIEKLSFMVFPDFSPFSI